jgi:hypothetical protein
MINGKDLKVSKSKGDSRKQEATCKHNDISYCCLHLVCSSETSINLYQTKLRHTPEDSTPNWSQNVDWMGSDRIKKKYIFILKYDPKEKSVWENL